jgi:hypothetical protein
MRWTRTGTMAVPILADEAGARGCRTGPCAPRSGGLAMPRTAPNSRRAHVSRLSLWPLPTHRAGYCLGDDPRVRSRSPTAGADLRFARPAGDVATFDIKRQAGVRRLGRGYAAAAGRGGRVLSANALVSMSVPVGLWRLSLPPNSRCRTRRRRSIALLDPTSPSSRAHWRHLDHAGCRVVARAA